MLYYETVPSSLKKSASEKMEVPSISFGYASEEKCLIFYDPKTELEFIV
jgi:hypothetical protein